MSQSQLPQTNPHGALLDPSAEFFFAKCGWLFKNAAQFAAGHIFSAEFRLAYLWLIFQLS